MAKQQIDYTPYVGAIAPDVMYTTRELCGRLAWSADDVSLALSKGLKTHVFGNHVYVFGTDVMNFIRAMPDKAGEA
jgi:hypothetical protein